MSEDSTERYYADMEHARNYHQKEYFGARSAPQLDALDKAAVFRAGFERAFKFLWERFTDAEADMLRLHRELMECKYPGSSSSAGDKS